MLWVVLFRVIRDQLVLHQKLNSILWLGIEFAGRFSHLVFLRPLVLKNLKLVTSEGVRGAVSTLV